MADFFDKMLVSINKGVSTVSEGSKSFMEKAKLNAAVSDGEKEVRSLMNVPFVTASKELDAEVVKATKAAGYDNLKGHKSVGGLRASIYNAMPKEGVEALVQFLTEFEAQYQG